jgi:hypothetical protein
MAIARFAPCLALVALVALLACVHTAPPPPPAIAIPVAPSPHPASPPDPPLVSLLTFERGADGPGPRDWRGGPAATVFADDKVVHAGHWSARLQRTANSPEGFSAMSDALPIDFAGKTVELRGFLKTDSVSQFAGLWLREDGAEPSLAFDNMQARRLAGTTDWTEYAIVLPLVPDATRLVFGALIGGTGTVWADDLQLLVDGKPVWLAPRAVHVPTTLESDREFDKGSGVTVHELSKVQIDDLALLGKVWGLLKYHHPVVTSGTRHWDYELFRVLPRVLSAPDRASARAAITEWVAGLGEVPDCTSCATLDTRDLAIKPDLAWVSDPGALGADLSQRLARVVRARPADGKQFYVSMVDNVGNPVFEHELSYPGKETDAGFRLLAVYRFWNMVQYWFPYRDLLAEPWDRALRDAIPRVMLASTPEVYARELMALIARVHDSHANLWSSLDVRPPTGRCELPVEVRFLGKSAVVARTTGPADASAGATGLQVGDVILALDGASPGETAAKLAPYYASSNDASRLRDFAGGMTRGDCTSAALRVQRDGRTLSLAAARTAPSEWQHSPLHDRPGPTFQKLSDDVAYLKLSSVRRQDIEGYVQAAAGTRGLVVDIRNYPSEFVVFELGARLVDAPTDFARFTRGDRANPGAFHWTPPMSLPTAEPRYSGKVAILVDETSQSQAEYTAMALRASPRAVVVGSTTAGADGNVSTIVLPGRLSSMFSGIGVFYPDKRPTQRIGIVPDIRVEPTLAGIRAGRDEVLEAALRHLLGDATPRATIEAMAKAPAP